MSGDVKWDLTKDRIEQARENGYQQGYRHGAEDAAKVYPWNHSAVRPKHGEEISAYVLPWSWKTRRFCKKRNIKYMFVAGVYFDGDTMCKEAGAEGFATNDWPDFMMIGKEAVEWEMVMAWATAEIPAWLKEEEEGL